MAVQTRYFSVLITDVMTQGQLAHFHQNWQERFNYFPLGMPFENILVLELLTYAAKRKKKAFDCKAISTAAIIRIFIFFLSEQNVGQSEGKYHKFYCELCAN